MTTATPFPSDKPAPLVALQVTPAGSAARLVFVDHDEFTIGSGDQCDLCLAAAGLPRLHSRLRVQGPAIWIEAVEDHAPVVVERETFRRRALRDGDLLTFGDVEATIHIGEASVRAARELPRSRWELEDLPRLSAQELCDRIELEESLASDFDRRRQLGWRALMSALQDIRPQGSAGSAAPQIAAVADEKFDALVAQVRELSDSLEARTRVLADRESLLIESSSQFAEAQLRVSRQLEQLLDRLAAEHDSPGELRVSA